MWARLHSPSTAQRAAGANPCDTATGRRAHPKRPTATRPRQLPNPQRSSTGATYFTESLRADPGLSNREHARRTGADHKTVQAVREESESTGEIPQSETRVSGDGRVRPASQPSRPEPEPGPDLQNANDGIRGSGQFAHFEKRQDPRTGNFQVGHLPHLPP